MTDDLATGSRITTSTAISFGLVVTMLVGTLMVGRYLQKIDNVEREVAELHLEIRVVRELLTSEFRRTKNEREERP